ncbi:aspartate/tyrosine/aromatic aminotransferase [Bremerella cremea]|uniref:Aminotransferase n=1 Tax=Blastopirellula marina TaxID=124 RepID=A0A2S8FJY2_9BACT|nr:MULTISPECIES: amino acid aminotransferase [Pirellulaceae]PQO32476.1 aromatic amino acid aminotransferase [Blastopirellula marina]RCS45543.1 aspartate/tyrosine/aromatic aminotransferase [Bremerella cremea]
MFQQVQTAPPDSILGLNEAFRNDPNPEKINLSVGVYKDEKGVTPVLKCVKEAEKRLLESESTKSYLPIDGRAGYNESVRELMFGTEHEVLAANRAVTVQTPGGTGALRVAGDFLADSFKGRALWHSQPTWPNHPNIFTAAGIPLKTYPYFDKATNGLDFTGMMEALRQAPKGDIILLHGCCHNPTGIDPTPEQWKEIGDLVQEKELLPLLDFAYQGFGDGLKEDAAGLREIARPGQEMLICSSFSKNFGLYNERVGALTAVAADEASAAAVLSQLKKVIRSNYSNPPTHGAAVVETVLADTGLNAMWEEELAHMRDRINGIRKLFVDKISASGIDQDFSFIQKQKGMFSFSGLNQMQVDQLRNEMSIYIVGSGRINVAGISEANVDRLCEGIKKVLS